MLFEVMRKLGDAIHVNLPIGGAFAFVSLTELESISKIGAIIVGAICTVLVTRHKLKQKDKE